MANESKIPILHIIKSLGRGGAEMLLPEALHLHDQQQFEFHYIYFLPWKDQMAESLRQEGGMVTCLNASDNLKIMMKTGEVIRYCKDHGIKLIHCHLPWAGFLGRIVYRRTGIPVIYTEHNKQERYHFITYHINKRTFNYQTLAIAVSEDVGKSIQTNIHPKIEVQTVLNGVNTDKFIREPIEGERIRLMLSIPMASFVVGTVAVFRFQKRLIEWIRVFAQVKKEVPGVHGIIVGDGPLKEEILALRKELQLESVLHMPGLQEEVRPYYSAMDIFMMTSSFEGLPVALLEAMSMSCAVVATEAGGIGEVIRQDKEGKLVRVDDWQQLGPKISALANKPEMRKRLGALARDRVLEAFSMQRMVWDLEKIYRQILSLN